MKLYFGKIETTVTTLLLIGLLIFIVHSLNASKRNFILHYGIVFTAKNWYNRNIKNMVLHNRSE